MPSVYEVKCEPFGVGEASHEHRASTDNRQLEALPQVSTLHNCRLLGAIIFISELVTISNFY